MSPDKMNGVTDPAEMEAAAKEFMRRQRIARAYGMIFWVLGGGIGAVVATAMLVTEFCPQLSPPEASRTIWSIAIPLVVGVSVLGWFATKSARVLRWSLVGCILLIVGLRLATYFV